MALQDISIAVTSTHLELQLQQNGPYQPYHKCKGWMTLNICHLLSIANCCNYPSFHFTCLLPDKFVTYLHEIREIREIYNTTPTFTL